MNDARASVTIAANAVPGLGGQGQNLAMVTAALEGAFALRVLTRQAVAPSRPARAIAATPLLRRRRDWLTSLDDGNFDRGIAAALGAAAPPAVFHGATGQCARSLEVARARGARTILDCVTLHVDEFGEALDASCGRFGIRPPLGPAYRRRCVTEYGRADVIRAISHRVRHSLVERGVAAERITAILPCISVPDEVPPPVDGRFRVGFVGLLEPWKGFDFLVEAFGALGLADAELHLCGGPGSRAASRYLRDAESRWRGILVHPLDVHRIGLAAAYGSFSVFVMPSLADGVGLVALEAMACGVPAIVTSAAGASELIDDGVSGFVVPPGDRDAIADRLSLLARDPDRRVAMGRAGRERMRALSREVMAAAYVEAVRRLLR